MYDRRELHLTLDLCLRIGEVLLSSGAGAADVTVTMEAVARHLGVRQPEIDVTFTSLSISANADPDDPPVVLMRVVRHRDLDYEDLTSVDHLVRDVLRDEADVYTARTRMATIVSVGHPMPRWAVTLFLGTMCASVGAFLGGGLPVMGIAGVAAMLIDRCMLAMQRRRMPLFYQQVVGGLVATLLAVALAASPLPLDPSLVITANVMVLLAGIGFLGAIQDALSGFYVTSGARMIEALLATAGIIAGVSGGLSLADVLGVDMGLFVPGRTMGDYTVVVSVLGGAAAAAAFAFACYAPRRAVLPIALITSIASVIHWVVLGSAIGRTWAAATASLFVGLVAYAVAGRVRVPPLVVVVPAIVPFLPGLSIYRGLSLLSQGGSGTSLGLLSLMTAASVAIAISSGVILGEYLAQPLKREARRLEDRLAGPRLVGPLRPRTRRDRRQRRERELADNDRTG
ncbi:MAG TPA: threonine/serine exporter family protein [Nocardioides sp.]